MRGRFLLVALGSVLGLGNSVAGPRGAGAPATATVEGEILRRQNEIIEAERLIADGDSLRTAGDWGGATAAYGGAYSGLSPSPLANDTINIARERFAAASVRYSLELIDAAEFGKAHEALDAVLDPAVHPSYGPALTLKDQLADPEHFNLARTPKHHANVAKVEKLLLLAKGAMDIADWDLANDYYTQVLRIDRTNITARRGQAEAESEIVKYLGAARDQTRAKMFREVDSAWETQVPISDSFGLGGGDTLGGNIGQFTVRETLANLIIDRVQYDEATIDEVVTHLANKSKQADPTGRGINIVLKLDPADPARSARITLMLRQVPLGEVLRIVTQSSGTRYRVDGFAVVVESAASGDNTMVTGRFDVPPDFLSSIANDGGAAVDDPFATPIAGGGGLNLRRLTAQEFLQKQGVTFPDGAKASFLPATSTLLVRNTPNNIELVRAIIDNSFSKVTKQAEIHVTMLDISQASLDELGFTWLLGQFNAPGSNRVFASGGTTGNSATTGSQAEAGLDHGFVVPGGTVPLGQHPLTAGIRSGRQWEEGDAINSILLGAGDSVLTNSGSLKAPGLLSVGGALTDPQFQMVMRGVAQSKGADILTSPSTVTRSGQRATIDVIREFPYATEYDPPEIPQSTGINFSDGTSAASDGAATPVTPAHPAAFEVRNLGIHLEVEPVIGEDNYTVELNLNPEITRFEGFVNYGSPITTTSTDILGGSRAVELTDNKILQPIFKIVRNTTAVTVWDGQTLVFGGLIEDRTAQVEDKTPIFGDAPLIGRFFRSNGESRTMRAVIFFVKVNVIGPSGQRINVREGDAVEGGFAGR